MKKREGEKRAGDQRRGETEGDFPSRTGEERQSAAIGFPATGEQSDGDGENAFGQPDAEPGERGKLMGGESGRGESREAQEDLSPPGDRGEGGRALHGVANEAKVVFGVERMLGGGAIGHGMGAMEAADAVRTGIEHGDRVTWGRVMVKYFAS